MLVRAVPPLLAREDIGAFVRGLMAGDEHRESATHLGEVSISPLQTRTTR